MPTTGGTVATSAITTVTKPTPVQTSVARGGSGWGGVFGFVAIALLLLLFGLLIYLLAKTIAKQNLIPNNLGAVGNGVTLGNTRAQLGNKVALGKTKMSQIRPSNIQKSIQIHKPAVTTTGSVQKPIITSPKTPIVHPTVTATPNTNHIAGTAGTVISGAVGASNAIGTLHQQPVSNNQENIITVQLPNGQVKNFISQQGGKQITPEEMFGIQSSINKQQGGGSLHSFKRIIDANGTLETSGNRLLPNDVSTLELHNQFYSNGYSQGMRPRMDQISSGSNGTVPCCASSRIFEINPSNTPNSNPYSLNPASPIIRPGQYQHLAQLEKPQGVVMYKQEGVSSPFF